MAATPTDDQRQFHRELVEELARLIDKLRTHEDPETVLDRLRQNLDEGLDGVPEGFVDEVIETVRKQAGLTV